MIMKKRNTARPKKNGRAKRYTRMLNWKERCAWTANDGWISSVIPFFVFFQNNKIFKSELHSHLIRRRLIYTQKLGPGNASCRKYISSIPLLDRHARLETMRLRYALGKCKPTTHLRSPRSHIVAVIWGAYLGMPSARRGTGTSKKLFLLSGRRPFPEVAKWGAVGVGILLVPFWVQRHYRLSIGVTRNAS